MASELDRIRQISMHIESALLLRQNAERNRAALKDSVDTVNALLMPKAWIGIDANGLLHVTYVIGMSVTDAVSAQHKILPTKLGFVADYIWAFRPWNSTVECIKSREATFKHGEIVPCSI